MGVKKIRTLSFLLLPAWGLLAAACSKTDPSDGEKVPLTFVWNGVEVNVAKTKAQNTVPLAVGSPVRVSARNSGGVSTRPYTSEANGELTGDPLFLLPSSSAYKVCAWSPSLELNADKSTVSVGQGSDFIATDDKPVTIATNTASMDVSLPVFRHKCARVELEVVRDETYTSLKTLEVWDKGVTMSNMPALQGTYTLGGDIGPDADPSQDLTLPPGRFAQLTDGRLGVNTVYVTLPKGEKEIPIVFYLVLNDNYLIFRGNVPSLSLLKGLGYKLVMSLRANQAALELRITDWTGHEINYEAGAGTGIVIGSWEIIEYDAEAGAGTGIKVGEWTEYDWQAQIGTGTEFSLSDWVEHEISYIIGRD